jgi:hypothetical protein
MFDRKCFIVSYEANEMPVAIGPFTQFIERPESKYLIGLINNSSVHIAELFIINKH